jgi:hypothetical protein
MAKFKKGDRVKVSVDSTSTFRGRVGSIQNETTPDSSGSRYNVTFESQGFRAVNCFAEQELETTASKTM